MLDKALNRIAYIKCLQSITFFLTKTKLTDENH